MNIFMSYASRDAGFADRLMDGFLELGIEVQDPAMTPPGVEWRHWIREGLERSDGVLLIVPETGSPGANNAFFEAGAAHALGKPVMAVVPRPQPDRTRELPADVIGLLFVDAAERPMRAIAETVVSALRAA